MNRRTQPNSPPSNIAKTMSKVPVKPFQPLPPPVRMERIRDAPHVHGSPPQPSDHRHCDKGDPWLIDSPTNRSVALLVTNSSGISQDTTLTAAASANENDRSSHDLWNPLMMMIMMDDEDEDDDPYKSPDPAATTTTAKRVSLDVSDACGMMMDVDTTHHPNQDLAMMTSTVYQDDHEFEFMEGLEHDPLLTLSVTDVENDVGNSGIGHVGSRISDSLHLSASVPQRLPSLRRLLSAQNHDYDVDHDGMNDPWTDAANEAAFQMTASTTDDQNDLMVFEIDQSFLKANGHTTTVGTESTVSSYSSVAPDFLSVLTGDNNHHHINTSTIPTFFTSKQFQERCQLLSESMRASQLSRQCLSLQENIKLRANLATVLKDIERSTAKVQRHCLSQQIQQHPTPPPSEQPPLSPVFGSATLFSTSPDHDSTQVAGPDEINNEIAQLANNNDHDPNNCLTLAADDTANDPLGTNN